MVLSVNVIETLQRRKWTRITPHMWRRLLTHVEFQLKFKRLTTPNVGETVRHPELSCMAGVSVNLLWKTPRQFLTLIHEPPIPFLGI